MNRSQQLAILLAGLAVVACAAPNVAVRTAPTRGAQDAAPYVEADAAAVSGGGSLASPKGDVAFSVSAESDVNGLGTGTIEVADAATGRTYRGEIEAMTYGDEGPIRLAGTLAGGGTFTAEVEDSPEGDSFAFATNGGYKVMGVPESSTLLTTISCQALPTLDPGATDMVP
jgi:hypothetical protein